MEVRDEGKERGRGGTGEKKKEREEGKKRRREEGKGKRGEEGKGRKGKERGKGREKEEIWNYFSQGKRKER